MELWNAESTGSKLGTEEEKGRKGRRKFMGEEDDVQKLGEEKGIKQEDIG